MKDQQAQQAHQPINTGEKAFFFFFGSPLLCGAFPLPHFACHFSTAQGPAALCAVRNTGVRLGWDWDGLG